MDEAYEEGQLVCISRPGEQVVGTVISADTRYEDEDGELYYALYGVEHPDGTQAQYEAEELEAVESILRVKARQEADLVEQRTRIEALREKLAQKNVQLIQAGLIPVDVLARLMPADSLTLSIINESELRSRHYGLPQQAPGVMRVDMAIDSRASHLGHADDLSPQVFDAILNELRKSIDFAWAKKEAR